ncbi:MAG: hypothetical protein ACYS8X_01850 [Planctomycetota bacterium]|jgi:hypothetical protein
MAKNYDIAKPAGVCCGSGKELAPGEEFMAALRQTPEQLVREDYSLEWWREHPCDGDADVLGVWRTRVPLPQEKKKLLIDNELLMNLFERLAGDEEPSRIRFRYVLTLILMRKKKLVYEGMTKDDSDRDLWRLRTRGSDQMHDVVDPHLDEDQIADVSDHLNEILEEPV